MAYKGLLQTLHVKLYVKVYGKAQEAVYVLNQSFTRLKAYKVMVATVMLNELASPLEMMSINPLDSVNSTQTSYSNNILIFLGRLL